MGQENLLEQYVISGHLNSLGQHADTAYSLKALSLLMGLENYMAALKCSWARDLAISTFMGQETFVGHSNSPGSKRLAKTISRFLGQLH